MPCPLCTYEQLDQYRENVSFCSWDHLKVWYPSAIVSEGKIILFPPARPKMRFKEWLTEEVPA